MKTLLSGHWGCIASTQETQVAEWLRNGISQSMAYSELAEQFIARGFFVLSETNEQEVSNRTFREEISRTDILQLILMPTEQCNFRCLYCYESFSNGKMSAQIQQSISNMVLARVNTLKQLIISWFGGEPLLALDVIQSLSQKFLSLSLTHDFEYNASMTTNGYRLTVETLRQLIALGIGSYQVTLDGEPEYHDRMRVRRGKQPTFEKIYHNLLEAKTLREDFHILIRINFDENSRRGIPKFFQRLQLDFAGDPRFAISLRAIGRWGSPRDEAISLCKDPGKTRMELAVAAGEHRLSVQIEDLLRPNGQVCYATKPYSFVIGSDGALYKCTVAMDDARNHVGHLRLDGTPELLTDRFSLWTADHGAEDTRCQSCHFSPVCQGAACPLVRIRDEKRPCPPEKRFLGQALQIAWNNRHL